MHPKSERSPLDRNVSKNELLSLAFLVVVCLSVLSPTHTHAQSPSALYTWDNSGNVAPSVEAWVKNFGANTVTLDNAVFGELRVIETGTPGTTVAISDGANRVRESSTASAGGTDLTGLSYLEFDIGHNGAGNINVQFFVQASTGFTFKSLGSDIAVTPGVNTYQVPLSGLTAAEAVYIRTIGFNARDHAALGNVTWTVREVRSVGTPLSSRALITHDAGTPEGGLQGAIANFDLASIQGNNGGQNQTGLSWNPAGSGSLQWTDLGGSAGAAIGWGNGTAWNGNTFNNRTADLSNYDKMIVRISAEDLTGLGGSVGVQGFFQKNNFAFQAAEGGATKSLAIDGQFYDLEFSLAGLTDMNVVDLTGINLGSHVADLRMNVDSITFTMVPEPQTGLLLIGGLLGLAARRCKRLVVK